MQTFTALKERSAVALVINSIASAIDYYLLDLQASGYSPHTVVSYRASLSGLAVWLASKDVMYVADVSPSDMREYMIYVRGRTESKFSVITLGRNASGFFNFCVREDLIKQNPMAGIRMPKRPRLQPTIVPENRINDLLNASRSQRDKAMFMFMLDTGVRRRECSVLNMEDIDIKTGRVYVKPSKNGRDRTVMMGKKTTREVVRYLRNRIEVTGRDSNALWTTQNKCRINPATISHLVHAAGLEIGIDIDAHSLRRTFATQMIKNGVNLYILKDLMGHSDTRTLEHYASLVVDDLEAAYQKMSPLDNM